MKKLIVFFIFSIFIISTKNVFSQNILLNILTQNSGVVSKGKIVFLEVSISNTSATKSLSTYKLRPQISFPSSIVSIADTGHILPKGWEIVSNKNAVLILTNGTDIIAENESRKILIAIKGKEIGGPFSIAGNLTFSNGVAPGTTVGTPTVGDNIADNLSSTSIKVVK